MSLYAIYDIYVPLCDIYQQGVSRTHYMSLYVIYISRE